MDNGEKKFLGYAAFLLILLFLLLSLVVRPTSGQEVIDCLVAEVDGVPVSLFDLKVVEAFQLIGSVPEVYKDKEEMLNSYLDRLLVLELAKGQLGASQEELNQEVDRLKNIFGHQEFEEKLASLGMKESDLFPYLQQKILYDKILSSRFNQKLYISLKEIEDYYQQVYVPEEKAKGGVPREMVNVLGEIEAQLQKIKAGQQLKEWVQELRQRADITIYLDCLRKI
ncbi:MAG: hypothetical protein C0168_05575 [Candidatus Aminicenantes bacterium]|nr:MAG: hypothetical protein C0168_05575 [Candidatus Aminicenantes bacterium]